MNFIGHRPQATILARHIEQGHVMHGYLFAGISGLGKTLVARWFAQGLLCSRPTAGMPCRTCVSCDAFEHERHPDMISIVDDEGSIIIDIIRELGEAMLLQPILSRRRVVLIEDAALCTPETWHALLKTLEEPRGANVYIFVTHSVHTIPLTIRSRLTLIPFQPLSLRELCTLDRVSSVAPEVLVEAAGRPGYLMRHVEQPPETLTLEDLIQSIQHDKKRDDSVQAVRAFCAQERAHLHVALATQSDAAPCISFAKRLYVIQETEELLAKHITPSLLVRYIWFTYHAYPVSASS